MTRNKRTTGSTVKKRRKPRAHVVRAELIRAAAHTSRTKTHTQQQCHNADNNGKQRHRTQHAYMRHATRRKTVPRLLRPSASADPQKKTNQNDQHTQSVDVTHRELGALVARAKQAEATHDLCDADPLPRGLFERVEHRRQHLQTTRQEEDMVNKTMAPQRGRSVLNAAVCCGFSRSSKHGCVLVGTLRRDTVTKLDSKGPPRELKQRSRQGGICRGRAR